MNTGWFLSSGFIWGALLLSGAASTLVLWLSPDGFRALHHRRRELQQNRQALLDVMRKNRELAEEVKRLAAKDPELLEHLARSKGYARPGESVFTFKERSNHR